MWDEIDRCGLFPYRAYRLMGLCREANHNTELAVENMQWFGELQGAVEEPRKNTNPDLGVTEGFLREAVCKLKLGGWWGS